MAGRRKRWDDFGDARLWAHIRFVCEHEGLKVRPATERIAARGWFTLHQAVKPGEKATVWLSTAPKPGSEWAEAAKVAKRGDKRNDEPANVYRGRYYVAERRRKRDPEFAGRCAFWLTFEREYARTGDADTAFSAACAKR